jgi:hypothetical protein
MMLNRLEEYECKKMVKMNFGQNRLHVMREAKGL